MKAALHPQPALPLLSLLLLLGCSAPGPGASGDGPGAQVAPESAASAAERARIADLPWTREFFSDAFLLADEVHVEGPPGLLQHVVAAQDPQVMEYSVQTLPEGLHQQTRARQGVGPVEIHAQLDNWRIVAFRRLTVLERPGDAPVLVMASGDATWQEVATGNRRSGAALSFRGERPE